MDLNHNCCMNFTETRVGFIAYMERPFYIAIKYCHNHDVPCAADFLKFLDGSPVSDCEHNFASYINVSHHMKQLPKKYKPFSIKISCCPGCFMPVKIKFITYVGDISRYPKVKDINKIKLENIPDANISEHIIIERT